ncbi:MFS transporter [Egibacter rhizosphaerae]|uniref:MFS transporter n=1 Tax=Egibacter rhizosphaerae TaxID=1670831 RepID=A0A411YBJ0_9ACTN|nr:MFS transporter [Egibacter rhizosphaerae]QBI18545.1 MFS transporter [Egibacter rhizosphaerae]
MSGWWAWGAVAALYGYGFFQRVAPSVLVDELRTSLLVGTAAVGGLSALFYVSMALAQVPAGTLLDRFGARRVLTAGSVLAALGSVAFAAAPNMSAASAGRILLGLAASVGFLGCMVVATRVLPPHRFGLAIGLAASIGMLGAMVGQAPLRLAVDALGWREAMAAVTLVPLLLAIACLMLIPRNRSSQEVQADSPAASGERLDLRSMLKRRSIWVCGIVSATLVLPVNVYAGLWAVPFLQEVRNFPASLAALAASCMLIGFGIGSPTAGWLATRTGRPRALLVGAFAVMYCIFVMLVYGPPLSRSFVYLLMVIAGAASGAMVLGFGLASRGVPEDRRGLAFGMANLVVLGFSALGQQASGYVLEVVAHQDLMGPHGTYGSALLLVVGAGVVGLVLTRLLPSTG